jgi:DNA-binding response OmpR family regulator
VIILSARGQKEDRIRGPTLGADDYVTKPFALDELLHLVWRLRGRAADHAEGLRRRLSPHHVGIAGSRNRRLPAFSAPT